MGGTCSMYGGEESYVQDFVGRPEDKRLLWRPRRRCGDNIKIHLQVNWVYLTQYWTNGGLLWTRWWNWKRWEFVD